MNALAGLLAGFSMLAAAPADDRPLVVLVGDSALESYAPHVARQLGGMARIIGVATEGGDSAAVRAAIEARAGQPGLGDARVVYFNAGLDDLRRERPSGRPRTKPDAYRANLAAIVRTLEEQTPARLVFANATPVLDARHNAAAPFDRHEADVQLYNAAAAEVIAGSVHAKVHDLHGFVLGSLDLENDMSDDGLTFVEPAASRIAAHVADRIKLALEDPKATREAVVRRTDAPPVIDGKLDDPAWERAEVIDRFPAFWAGRPSDGSTRARLLWDDEALYFAAEMDDAHLRAFGTRRNDMLWNGDVFELFFKPRADRPEYYEFQVNPRSAILELAFPRRGFDFTTLAARPPMGFRAVAVADGTIDKPGDFDRGWTAEGKIPWSVFNPSGGRPEPGASWSFALCRYDYGPEGTEPVTSSSAPLRRWNFHRYEDYGRLTFEGVQP